MSKGKMVAEGLVDQLGRDTIGGGQFKIEVQLAEITVTIVDAIKRVEKQPLMLHRAPECFYQRFRECQICLGQDTFQNA